MTRGSEQPTYKSVTDPPRIRTLLIGSALGRTAGGMVPIGLVLLLEHATSSFAFAGTMMGRYALAMVLAGPARSALAVRLGHRTALLALAALSSAGLLGVVAGDLATAPTYLLGLSVALSGASAPPFGALMRTTWSYRLPDSAVPRASRLDSVIEESSFVVGPLLASAILATAGPTTTVVVTATLCACVSAPEQRCRRDSVKLLGASSGSVAARGIQRKAQRGRPAGGGVAGIEVSAVDRRDPTQLHRIAGRILVEELRQGDRRGG